MFRVYLLYISREKKRQNSRCPVIYKCKEKKNVWIYGHAYESALVCHRKPICRRAFYDLKIFWWDDGHTP
jgi:hypothetical protein